jgi:hypothetical protein
MKFIKPMYVVIIAIVVAVVGFFAGTQYQKSQPVNYAQSVNGGASSGAGGQIVSSDKKGITVMSGNGNFQRRQGGMMRGARPVSGQIVSSDTKSITVKLPDGSSKIVNYSDQTKINKSSAGSVSDFKTGETVMVIGETASDGSVTAQNIAIGTEVFRGAEVGESQTPANPSQK